MDKVTINKHIDTLPMFLNWEIDVLIVFFATFQSGVLFTNSFLSLVLFVICGILLSYLYSRFKSTTIKGIPKHIMYVLGFRKTKYLIPSHKRNFLGA